MTGVSEELACKLLLSHDDPDAVRHVPGVRFAAYDQQHTAGSFERTLI